MGSVQSIERLQDIPFHSKVPSLNTDKGGYVVTQILSIAHIKSSTYSDLNSYFRDANPDQPRRRCTCADVEIRQRTAVRNRLYLVKRLKEMGDSVNLLEGLLTEAFIDYELNPHMKGKKGLQAYIKFSDKDMNRFIDYGILASNKVSNNLKIYLAEKARCVANPGCDLSTLNALQRDCHATLDQLEDVDTKFLKLCDMIGFFFKFCEPVDNKPIEETSHWTPIFARYWGTLVLFLLHLLPGYALCRIKSFTKRPLEDLGGYYVEEGLKKTRLELIQKWEKYREFLGTIATDLKESREVVLRLASKYLARNFRGEDAKRPHCILDQFILLEDQLKVMKNYFTDVLETIDGLLLYAHTCVSSLWYNPIFEVFYGNISTFFPFCMPNFFTTILSLYGGYISKLDLGSADCLICKKECKGLIRFACQECLADAVYGTYCSPECRRRDEADHAKICSVRPEESLRKYKSLFVPMKAKPMRLMNWRDEGKVDLKDPPETVKKQGGTPLIKQEVPKIVEAVPKPKNTPQTQGGYLQRKTQRMQERMAKRKDRKHGGGGSSETKKEVLPTNPCQEVERRHLKILQQRPDLR
ncbi:Uncharacterized protein FKW44_001902 [Caligus rogercresseyi]|uniref:Uncharacterized protein n=1 Tax=Caligus rogercresseyi TaxID=217165 RepID=A0A7T8KJM1_CALRO|nr:Uncharacterized protein FKW44_001902 [Caligus rogercresseyi]